MIWTFFVCIKLLHELEGKENRKARFRTVIALILDGKRYLFEGKVEGTIVTSARGKSGFGYDPVFQPEGYDKTFAELNPNVKSSISHRKKAITKMTEIKQIK